MQVSVDIQHHRTLYDLHHRVNAKEQIVGWCALAISVSACLLQRHATRLLRNPASPLYSVLRSLHACRYATGSQLTGPDALIQDFYAAECANAVRPLPPAEPCTSHPDSCNALVKLMNCFSARPVAAAFILRRTDKRPCPQVHLTVDTAMDTGSIKISAFVARKLTLGDRLLARKFQEVECEIDTQEIETVGGAPAAAVLHEV